MKVFHDKKLNGFSPARRRGRSKISWMKGVAKAVSEKVVRPGVLQDKEQ